MPRGTFRSIDPGSVPLHQPRCYLGKKDYLSPRGGSRCVILGSSESVPLHQCRCDFGGKDNRLPRGGGIYAMYKFEIIFSLQLGLATVWAQGNYSIKLFRISKQIYTIITLLKDNYTYHLEGGADALRHKTFIKEEGI